MRIPDGDFSNIPATKSLIPTTDDAEKAGDGDQYMSFDQADDVAQSRNGDRALGGSALIDEEGKDDSFARVTWTDLAKGKTTGARKKEGLNDSAAADYSLAKHNKKDDIEAIDEEDDMLSNAPSSQHGTAGQGQGDDDAPQEFKPKFVRRQTIARQQFLEQLANEDEQENYKNLDKLIENPTLSNMTPSRDGNGQSQARLHSASMNGDQQSLGDMGTEAGDDEEDELFGAFQFRSFKT